MKRLMYRFLGVSVVGLLVLSSCSPERSTSTGWNYNDYKNGGFEKVEDREQETGPGLVMIEGGTFTMGRTEQDVMYDWNARAARVTVASFYMDRTEVTNLHWLEYMYWMKRVYNKTYPHVYKKCLPDTLAWRSALGYREKYVNYYLRHPSYADYPVVGVSWLQANDFCKWRTDRVNEAILVREGIIDWHFVDDMDESGTGAANQTGYEKNTYVSTPQNMFTTENYLNGNYVVESKKGFVATLKGNVGPKLDDKKRPMPRDPYQLENYDPIYANEGKTGSRAVKMEDGILLPNYRLPTEAEWEFAALGLIGNMDAGSENINDRRIYPWDGHYVRQEEEQFAGAIQANFIRGGGDLMGVAGNLNDGADITARVDDFWPNDFGLYNMAGNVSEWVMDVYRPMTGEVADEFMPFRGNKYQTQLLVPNGLYDRPVKANENLYDVHGMKEFVNEFARVKYLAYANKAYDASQNGSSNFVGNIPDQAKINAEALQKAEEALQKAKDFSTLVTTAMNKFAGKVKAIDKQPITDALKALNDAIAKSDFKNSKNLKTEVDLLNTLQTEVEEKIEEVATNGIVAVEDVLNEVKNQPAPAQGNVQPANVQQGIVNNAGMNSKINARQDVRAYQFNTPSSYYISNNREYSVQVRRQFEFLDTLNAFLDTAIVLYNQGRTVAASAYIERVLFNESLPTEFKDDYNKSNTSKQIRNLIDVAFNRPESDESEGFGYLIDDARKAYFGSECIDKHFESFYADPELTTWIMTLRNGLTEFITTTKGNQRWRNVTVEENAGRLNYRKDDYIDYMDGDLESSIYYNNAKTKESINNGSRDVKQVMYQSEHENSNLNGDKINTGSTGWPTTLISDKSRVYKGGSWADRVYWLSAGNRRFLDEDKATATIGFRCAMDRVGSSRPKGPKE